MATESPIVSMAPTRVTNTKAGNRAQKVGPKLRSKPGHALAGTPNHAASAIRLVSYNPKNAATTVPATIPMTGAQRRSVPVAFKPIATITTMVATALNAAPDTGPPSGTSVSMSKTMGITVTAISMITVPATVGVRMRRNRDRRFDSAN